MIWDNASLDACSCSTACTVSRYSAALGRVSRSTPAAAATTVSAISRSHASGASGKCWWPISTRRSPWAASILSSTHRQVAFVIGGEEDERGAGRGARDRLLSLLDLELERAQRDEQVIGHVGIGFVDLVEQHHGTLGLITGLVARVEALLSRERGLPLRPGCLPAGAPGVEGPPEHPRPDIAGEAGSQLPGLCVL